MGKVAIITDSVANLPQEIIKNNNVQILPINIWFNGKKYRDGIELGSAESYRMLAEKPDQFHSTPASVGEYPEIFKNAAKATDAILYLTLSTSLSAVYNIASLANRPVHISITHLSSLEAGIKLKDNIEKKFNCIKLWLTDLSQLSHMPQEREFC